MISEDTRLDTLEGQIPVCDVPDEGHVMTPKGVSPYTRALSTESPVVRVKFADGHELVCSPDQRLVTRRGWIRADRAKGQYCFVQSALARYIRVTSVEPEGTQTTWSVLVKHHEHRFLVNDGIAVAN